MKIFTVALRPVLAVIVAFLAPEAFGGLTAPEGLLTVTNVPRPHFRHF
jgi:hypothetical protein